jgi:subtilase family serine protease
MTMLKGLRIIPVLMPLITSAALAQEHPPLHTHIAAQSGARLMGRMQRTQRLQVAMTLHLRNESQLDALLQRLYQPTSADYRHFLSVEEFTEQFAPTPSDYATVVNYAASHGLTVTSHHANRLVVEVEGSVTDIERAFHVNMQTYQHPTENRTYFAPDVEPSVDAGVAVAGISGLNNFITARPMSLRHADLNQVQANATGSQGGQFLGSDIRAAYAPGVTLTGAGQAVGLLEFGPYLTSDITNYFSNIGQPLNVPITNVLLNGVSGVCGDGCDDGEEAVDIQQAISMAPGIKALYVYEGNNDVSILNRMATDNLARQLSCSFGWLPADPSSDEPIFKEFAAQGQNLFVASGDSGAFTSNGNSVFYPADDPFITSVGGTDLTTNGAGGTWKSETTWIGSGGGTSTNNLAIPSYQSPVITSANAGSTTLRNLPDVAAEANTDNYFCANNTCQGGIGGTSLAAPRWAGFLALANQQAAGAPIGFVNPTLYSIGRSAAYNNDLHDINSGNNFNSHSPNNFAAVTGYDLATGWGAPSGQALIDALAGKNLNGAHTLTPQNVTSFRLDDLSSSTASGNPIDVWPANGTGAQSWVFSNVNVVPSGNYNLAVSYGAFCMAAASASNGTAVNLQPCDGSSGQSWQVAAASNGNYVLHPAINPALCLDVKGADTAAGTVVIGWDCNGGTNESWAIN